MSTRPGSTCPFCEIVAGAPKATKLVREYDAAVVFRPLSPVVDGHLLVVPRDHVRDAAEEPAVTAWTYRVAALEAQLAGPCNLITSVGAAATQTVMHLHVHVVPRRVGDGLRLPWTGQVEEMGRR